MLDSHQFFTLSLSELRNCQSYIAAVNVYFMLKMSLFSCFCLVFFRATMADIFVFPYLLFDIPFKLPNALMGVEDKTVLFCCRMPTLLISI